MHVYASAHTGTSIFKADLLTSRQRKALAGRCCSTQVSQRQQLEHAGLQQGKWEVSKARCCLDGTI
jgi:hypothetical protein